MSFTERKNFKQFSQSLIGLKLKKNKIKNREENNKQDNNDDQLEILLNKLKTSQMKIKNISNSLLGDAYLSTSNLNPTKNEININNIPLVESQLIVIEEENEDNNNIINTNKNNNNNFINTNNDNNNIINTNNNNNIINNNKNNIFIKNKKNNNLYNSNIYNKNNYFDNDNNNNINLSPNKLKSVSKSAINNFVPKNIIDDDIDTNVDFTIINYFKYNDKEEIFAEKKEIEKKKIEEELLRRKKENENLKKEIEEIKKQREEQERKNKENEEKIKKQKEEEKNELLRKQEEEEEKEKERKLNEEEIRLQREILEKEDEEEKKIQRIKQERLEREKKERLEKERKEKEKREKENLENNNLNKEIDLNNKKENKILDDDIEIEEISNSNFEEITTNKINNNIFKQQPQNIINDKLENDNINNKESSSNEDIKLKSINPKTEKEIENRKKQNEDLISKLNENEKKEIEQVINNIYSFDTNNPDLSNKDSFYIIKSLDKNDIELKDLIEDFEEEIINPDNKKMNKKRRKNFLNKNYFNYKIEFNSQFEQFLSSNRLPHPNYMYKAFKSCNFNEELPHLKNNFEETIFQENNLIDNILSPISNLENFETFVYKYSCHDNYKLMISANKNFNLWRKCLFDGNSFYRVFMFCLIENYIINNNIKDLEILIAELIYEKNIDLYNENNIDSQTFLIILSGLRNYLKENQIEKAYDLFLKSYLLKNKCFDKALIIYLRNVIFKYLKEVYHEEELYYKEKKQNYKDNKINLQALKNFNIEPEFIILIYITYLYNVNLNILWIDSDFNNPKNDLIPFIDDNSDNILISIGYFFSGYVPLYDRNLSKNQFLQKKISENKISIKQLTYLLNEKRKCNICNKKTTQLIFLQKKFIICYPCLSKHINEILYKRGVNLLNNKFNGIEYSTKPIHLDDKFYIEEDEFIEIVEKENIINKLNNTITSICVSCKKLFKINQLSVLKCLCRYCENCLIEKSNSATNNLKILNKYEKKTFSKQFCQCGNLFDIDDATNYRKDIKNIDINNAKKRMEIYIKTLCMICLKRLKEYNENNDNNINNNNNDNDDNNNDNNDNIKINNIEIENNEDKKENEEEKKEKNKNKNKNIKEKNETSKLYVIKLKKENASGKGLNYSDIDHLMCIDCYYKMKKIEMDSENNLIEQDNDNNNKKEKNKKINCNICCKSHYIDSDSNEKNNRGCCNNCYIF